MFSSDGEMVYIGLRLHEGAAINEAKQEWTQLSEEDKQHYEEEAKRFVGRLKEADQPEKN